MNRLQCLAACERVDTKTEGEKKLRATAEKSFAIPGDSKWGLGGMYPPPKTPKEGDTLRAYFKQARDEVAIRVLDLLYLHDGSKNKWWASFSKRKVGFYTRTMLAPFN